ncbi:MAG TPA: 2-dehydropantoate 2-reductase [Bacteroides sp.]|nr:2-dehydropantoate 2-reductase [Bacteroides sp.]
MDTHAGILVIGAGAIGSITAGMLSARGIPVTLVCRNAEQAGKIASGGIQLSGRGCDRLVRVRTAAGLDRIACCVDTVFLATKAYQVQGIARQLVPLLNKDSRVVSMQNGIVIEELAGIVGAERSVGCVVRFGATLHEPGVAEMTSRGRILVGYPDRPGDGQLDEIARIMENIAPVAVTGRIMSELYSKLIINSCTSTVGAISGLTLGELLKKRRARQIFTAVAREALRVAGAGHLHVAPLAGRLTWEGLLHMHPALRQGLIRLLGMRYRHLRSSSLRAIERGRSTEVDFLNGHIVRKGVSLGVDSPVNRRLVEMIHEMEQGRRPATPLNLEDDQLARHL